MRCFTIALISLMFFVGNIHAQNSFTKKASKQPQLTQKGEGKQWCKVCGMSLKMFYKTSHAAHSKNGDPTQYCSIRCLVVANENGDIDLEKAKVVDVVSEKLILAKKAFYVVGSKVQGTMSKVSKLAFANEIDALEFGKKMGGEIVGFDKAYDMALKSLKKDISMTNKKRSKMMYPMGKKLLKSRCKLDKLDLASFRHINELKPIIKKRCKKLKEKQAQAVALYLWDVKRFKEDKKHTKMVVDKNEKCPVCGMFVGKFQRWVAKISHKDTHLYFDGVKDMMKYINEPKKYGAKDGFTAKNIMVTDYYTQFAIDGKKAFYVTGSDVLGPMGHELIPFKKLEDAKTFLKDHKGEKILKLKEITSSILCKLDGKECE